MDFIGSLLCVICIVLPIIVLFDIKMEKWKFAIIILAIGLVSYSVYTKTQQGSMLVLMILVIVMLVYYQMKLSYAFLSVLFLLILSVILQYILIVVLVYAKILIMESFQDASPIIVLFVFTIIGFLNTVLALILKKYIGFGFFARANKADNKPNRTVIASLILVFCVTYYFAFYAQDMKLSAVTVVLITFVFLFAVIIYIDFRLRMKDMTITNKVKELEQLQEYTQKLEEVHSNMSRIRHDYLNVLASMIGYMDERNMDGLIRYFDNEIIPFTNHLKENEFKLSLLGKLKQVEIKGIIASKVFYAFEKKVEVYIDIAEDFSVTGMEIIDLCRILGILMDNAVEGAMEAEERKLEIGFVKKEKLRIMVISNSCKRELPPIYKLYEENFSTKGKGRGLGLANVRAIFKKYKNGSMDTILEEGMFKQIIQIEES